MRTIDFRYDLLPLKDKVYRLALRITLSTAEAEDVTQDTLLRVWEKRDELATVDSLEAYVLTVGRHMALDRTRRSEAANLSIEATETDAADVAPNPHERLERDERLRRIHDIVSALPEQQRTVMQLRDVEGRAYGEIAAIVGISEANVKVTLHRARQTVKQQYLKLENYGL